VPFSPILSTRVPQHIADGLDNLVEHYRTTRSDYLETLVTEAVDQYTLAMEIRKQSKPTTPAADHAETVHTAYPATAIISVRGSALRGCR